MADESLDVEAITGGGGYVDDDIDLDDDDDEPLTGAVRPLDIPSVGQPPAKKLRIDSMSTSPASTDAAALAEEQPQPTDLLLRPGSRADRDIMLARFLTTMPDLETAERVRLYRQREGTAKGRSIGLEAHRKQQAYYNSFVGKRRLERYKTQGLNTIPERARKGWILEVAKEGTTPTEPPPPPERGQPQTYPPEADVFTGAFDGLSGSSYALMVMHADGRNVDVVPVGQHAWFSFRSARPGGAATAEEAAAAMQKLQAKGEKRIGKLYSKYEEAQERREGYMGGHSRFEEKRNVSVVGLRRKISAKKEAEKETGGEFMDFEQEFDNDDLLQIDKEEVENTKGERKVRNVRKHQELIRKLIKDEQEVDAPKSPRSDSDDDEANDKGSKPPSRSPSPPRSTPGSRAISPARQLPGGRPPVGRSGSARPTSAVTGPGRSQPPSNAVSRAGTPQLMEFSDILPPPGTLPTAKHVTAVLQRLIKQKGVVKLKDLFRFFERNTEEQKTNLRKVIKLVGLLREESPGSKVYLISLKPTQS